MPHESEIADVVFHTEIRHKRGELAMTFLRPFFPVRRSNLVQLRVRVDKEMFSIYQQTAFIK